MLWELTAAGGVTCASGIPGEVVEIGPEQPDLAKVNVSGVKRLVGLGPLSDDPPKPGEWVLVGVGFALSKIDEAEAAAAMENLEGSARRTRTRWRHAGVTDRIALR